MGGHCREDTDLTSLTTTSHSDPTSVSLQHQNGIAYSSLGLHSVGVGQLGSQEYHSHGTSGGHAILDDLIPWNRVNPWVTQASSVGQPPQPTTTTTTSSSSSSSVTATVNNNHHMSSTAAAVAVTCQTSSSSQNGVTTTFNDVFPPGPPANGYLTGAEFSQTTPFYYPAGQFGGTSLRGLTL